MSKGNQNPDPNSVPTAAASTCTAGARPPNLSTTLSRHRSKYGQPAGRPYRCTGCGHSFRFYPEGVARPYESLRLIGLTGLAWALGHSTRSAAWFSAALGTPLSRMSVWRDAQRLAQRLKARLKGRKVRVLGLDETSIRSGGSRRGVIVAVGLGTGEPVALAEVDPSREGRRR